MGDDRLRRAGTDESHQLRSASAAVQVEDDAQAVTNHLIDLLGDQYRVVTTPQAHDEIVIRLRRYDDSDMTIRDCLVRLEERVECANGG